MPQTIAEIEHAAPVVARERLALLVEVRHVDHALLEAILVVSGDVAALGILDLAEIARERHLLIVCDVLVAEHQHRIAIHAGIDRGSLLARQRLAQVDARNLADEYGMDLADREHGFLHCRVFARSTDFSRMAAATPWRRLMPTMRREGKRVTVNRTQQAYSSST